MTIALPTISAVPSPAPAGDSLKDADNLSFLAGQPADVRAVWEERCRLFRWVDQLAESDRWAFGEFVQTWRWHENGRARRGATYMTQVRLVDRLWFTGGSDQWELSTLAWSCWLDAISADYGRSLVPVTLEQHDEMVEHVGGFFRLFPYLTPEQWESIGAFGALDQAWNNVRDTAEDAARGCCSYPTPTLGNFGIRRETVIDGTVAGTRRWEQFMTLWLDHLRELAGRASAFLAATDLHPSVDAMRASCLRRYERIERVMRGVDFDYRAFVGEYEAEVRRELAVQALGAKEVST